MNKIQFEGEIHFKCYVIDSPTHDATSGIFRIFQKIISTTFRVNFIEIIFKVIRNQHITALRNRIVGLTSRIVELINTFRWRLIRRKCRHSFHEKRLRVLCNTQNCHSIQNCLTKQIAHLMIMTRGAQFPPDHVTLAEYFFTSN